MRTAFAGRGHMTAAVDALSRVALAQPGVERVAIRHDETNLASAAVAAKAGFREVARVARGHGTDIIRERRTGTH
jgi:RimJ/RimL family protein N-acetyltransferase